ncbi:hypothetical protein [Fusobacterium sp. SYSU M8D902]|uniref:hypothetical protein n=1 Tax=Fusobacterium sp. SYSU M8D902 TaxID=3159562 RepID=UPI0032E4057B
MGLFSSPYVGYSINLDKDFKILIKYLKNEYPNKYNSSLNSSLKKLHKILWILSVTRKNFLESNIYFSDILTTTLSYINTLLLKDLKTLKFLSRNSIEDFIKFSKIFFCEIDTSNAPRDIFPSIFKNSSKIEFIHIQYQFIKNKYSEISYVLHGNNINNIKISKQLKEHSNLYSNIELEKEVNVYCDLVIKFLEIYYFYFFKDIDKLPQNEIFILRELLSKEWLLEIQNKVFTEYK